MNVKSGDLAIIVVGESAGSIVSVLRAEAFRRVDGMRGHGEMGWIIKFDRPVPMKAFDGVHHSDVLDVTGWCRDSALRPVSGIPDTEETNAEITIPDE